MDQNIQSQIDEINRRLDSFLSEYNRNNNPSSQVFTKNCQFVGGLDLSQTQTLRLGATGGSIGLYGETPTTQFAAIAAPSNPSAGYVQAEAASAVSAINSIRTALQQIGIIA